MSYKLTHLLDVLLVCLLFLSVLSAKAWFGRLPGNWPTRRRGLQEEAGEFSHAADIKLALPVKLVTRKQSFSFLTAATGIDWQKSGARDHSGGAMFF